MDWYEIIFTSLEKFINFLEKVKDSYCHRVILKVLLESGGKASMTDFLYRGCGREEIIQALADLSRAKIIKIDGGEKDDYQVELTEWFSSVIKQFGGGDR